MNLNRVEKSEERDTSVVRQYPFTCACHENLQQQNIESE